MKRFRPSFRRHTTFDHRHDDVAGLMADRKRKSIEPIAPAAGVPVRTFQEFPAVNRNRDQVMVMGDDGSAPESRRSRKRVGPS